MKIAVSAKGAGLGAWLDPDFETCLQMVIVDESDRFIAWMNPFRDTRQENPTGLAQKLAQEQVDTLITGTISAPSLAVLTEAGMIVLSAEKGSILELVEAARRDSLHPPA